MFILNIIYSNFPMRYSQYPHGIHGNLSAYIYFKIHIHSH